MGMQEQARAKIKQFGRELIEYADSDLAYAQLKGLDYELGKCIELIKPKYQKVLDFINDAKRKLWSEQRQVLDDNPYRERSQYVTKTIDLRKEAAEKVAGLSAADQEEVWRRIRMYNSLNADEVKRLFREVNIIKADMNDYQG